MAQRLLRRHPLGRRRAGAAERRRERGAGAARTAPPALVLADNDARRGTIRRCRSTSAWRYRSGRPLAPRLMSAMAQQDCGQCGYNCADYANALFLKKEERLTLCAPGGKETARMLKQLAGELRRSRRAARSRRRRRRPRRRERGSFARQSGRGDVPLAPPPERRRLGEDDLARRVRPQRQAASTMSSATVSASSRRTISALADQVIAALGADPRRDRRRQDACATR